MNTVSKKVTTHPDIAHPRQSPVRQLRKESLYSPLGKVAESVFQTCAETTLDRCDLTVFVEMIESHPFASEKKSSKIIPGILQHLCATLDILRVLIWHSSINGVG